MEISDSSAIDDYCLFQLSSLLKDGGQLPFKAQQCSSVVFCTCGKPVQNYDGSSIILNLRQINWRHVKNICPLCQPKSSTPSRHWLLKNKPCIIHCDSWFRRIWDSFSQIAHKKHVGASLPASLRRRTARGIREAAEREEKSARDFHLKGLLCVCECGSLCVWGEVYWASELAQGHDQTRVCTWVTPPLQHEINHTVIKSQLLYKLLFCLRIAATLKGLWELTLHEHWPRGPKPTTGEMRENVTHDFQMKPLAVVFGTGWCGLTQARRRCQLSLPVSPLWSKSGKGEKWNKDLN